MPDHIHGIVLIVGADPRVCPDHARQPADKGQPQGVAPTVSLPDIVRRFKALTTKLYAVE